MYQVAWGLFVSDPKALGDMVKYLFGRHTCCRQGTYMDDKTGDGFGSVISFSFSFFFPPGCAGLV